jgi:hypothetical protein
MEMHTACYYTLSTISQTLAGAFGFLLAVVLYRIQAIGNGLPGKTGAFEVEEIPPLAGQRPPFLELRRKGDWAGYLDLATRKLDAITGVEDREKAVALLLEIRADVDKVGAIKRSLEWSLRWTAGTVIACLILLPLTPLFEPGLAWVLMAATVAAAVYSITTYLPLIGDVTT